MDFVKKTWAVTIEALSSFRRNKDLSSASSLAFSAMLALIPALFLITALIGMAIGSSQEAFRKVQEIATQLIPSYSEAILREVRYLASHKRAIGAVNGLILLFAVTPLVSELRAALDTVFRARRSRPFLLEKLVDAALTILFLVGITAVAAAGATLAVAGEWLPLPTFPGYLGPLVQFLFQAATVFLLYYAFSRGIRPLHLAAGALASSCLWFALRPAFHLFLAYNPGYGFAFGSFKSLFVVVIWIYCSLALFLFGAEVAAGIGRKETVYIKRLILGRGGVPASFAAKHVVRYEKGAEIFREGDEGSEMFAVRKGSVGIIKDGVQISVVPAGKCFGEMSFLLASPRATTAVALEDAEVVAIGNEGIKSLMNEYPEFVVGLLRDMALRLREANRLID